MSKVKALFIAANLIVVLGGTASAQQTASVSGTVSISGMGAPVNPPLGYAQFCRDYLGECRDRRFQPTSIALSEANWHQIVKINADVNAAVEPVTDIEHWGLPEQWNYPDDGKGDCEDYVLEKRRRLIKAGLPEQTLLITVVRDHKGDGHAVLTVKTDRGDFVLDNQVGKILAWQETGYRFIKRQSDENPFRWVSLGGVDTRNVASAKR